MSQNEIENLLESIILGSSNEQGEGEKKGKRYFHYDFMRPHKFPNSSIRLLEAAFERGANHFSEFARNEFCVDLASSSAVGTELTVEDYRRCIEEKVLLIPYSIKTEKGNLSFFVTLPSDLLSPFFSSSNKIFSDDKWIGKKLPVIINAFLVKFGNFLIDGMGKNDMEMGPILYIRRNEIEVIEKEDSDNMGLLITLKAKSGDIAKCIDIFLPYEFYQAYFSKLESFKKEASPFACERQPGNGYVPLGWCEINDRNRYKLAPGGIIRFELFITDPLPLVLRKNNLIFAEGFVTMVDENYAVHITKVHADPKKPNVVRHYGDYGLNILPGNVYACLGEFQIHDEKEVNVDDVVELNKATYDLVDLIEKNSGKVIARGEVFNNHYLFAVKITEVL